MDRAFILSKIPEIGMIRQQELREKCLDTWLLAAQRAAVEEDDLDKITFAGHVLKGCTMNLLEHTRAVMRTAAELARQFNANYGGRIPADEDIVLCAAALHDVGKVYEHGGDHKGVFLPENQYLTHPYWGAVFAQECGCPWQVVYAILIHSDESGKQKHIPESFIVFNADWLNFKYLCFGYDWL